MDKNKEYNLKATPKKQLSARESCFFDVETVYQQNESVYSENNGSYNENESVYNEYNMIYSKNESIYDENSVGFHFIPHYQK